MKGMKGSGRGITNGCGGRRRSAPAEVIAGLAACARPWGRVFLLVSVGMRAGPALCADTQGLTITVTPQVEFGVVVTPSTEAFTLAAGTPTFSAVATRVRIVGNAQPVELDLKAAISSFTPWVLSASTAPAVDALQVWGVFSDVGRSTRPADGDFLAPERLITAPVRRAGGRFGDGAAFESPAVGADMDGLAVGDERKLWLRLDAPPASTTAAPQTLSITMTATRDDL